MIKAHTSRLLCKRVARAVARAVAREGGAGSAPDDWRERTSAQPIAVLRNFWVYRLERQRTEMSSTNAATRAVAR